MLNTGGPHCPSAFLYPKCAGEYQGSGEGGIIYFLVTKCELGVAGLHDLADFLGVDNAGLKCQIGFWLRKFTKSEQGSRECLRMNLRISSLSGVAYGTRVLPFCPTRQ